MMFARKWDIPVERLDCSMKRIISLAVLIVTLASPIVIGQKIPSGPWAAQPSFGDTNTVSVLWLDQKSGAQVGFLTVSFGSDGGNVTDLFYNEGYGDTGIHYRWPSTLGTTDFRDLRAWQKFSARLKGRFTFLDEDLYVDNFGWTFVGRSVVLDHWELAPSIQGLIFKRGQQNLAIPLSRWRGAEILKIGETVTIGQNGRGEYFFPAHLEGGRWCLSKEMAEQVAKDRAERLATKTPRRHIYLR